MIYNVCERCKKPFDTGCWNTECHCSTPKDGHWAEYANVLQVIVKIPGELEQEEKNLAEKCEKLREEFALAQKQLQVVQATREELRKDQMRGTTYRCKSCEKSYPCMGLKDSTFPCVCGCKATFYHLV